MNEWMEWVVREDGSRSLPIQGRRISLIADTGSTQEYQDNDFLSIQLSPSIELSPSHLSYNALWMNEWNEPSGKTDLAHWRHRVYTRVPRQWFFLDELIASVSTDPLSLWPICDPMVPQPANCGAALLPMADRRPQQERSCSCTVKYICRDKDW